MHDLPTFRSFGTLDGLKGTFGNLYLVSLTLARASGGMAASHTREGTFAFAIRS
jgi:hypothetical protein